MAYVSAFYETGPTVTVKALIHNQDMEFADIVAEAFETYDANSLVDYDIAAGELGATGEYYFAFPTWITAGRYVTQFIPLAGATIVESDLLNRFGVGTWYWDGTNLTPVKMTDIIAILADTDVMPAAVKTALEVDGSKLDHLWETTEDDAGVRRYTENALEQASGTGASAESIWAYTNRTLSGTAAGTGPTAQVTNTDGVYTVPTDGTLGLYKRLRKWDGDDITQAYISTMTYSIYALDPDNEDTRTDITGHTAESMTVADHIFDTVQDDAAASDYNFKFIPSIATNQIFEDTNTIYLVEVIITPADGGEMIVERFQITTV